jgi:hypothetical protein
MPQIANNVLNVFAWLNGNGVGVWIFSADRKLLDPPKPLVVAGFKEK